MTTSRPHRYWINILNQKQLTHIQAETLDELWFHTGNLCDAKCRFCQPDNDGQESGIENLTLDEVRPFVDEALLLGVKQFSFFGGEPFCNPDMIAILSYALDRRPTLVMTYGARPLRHQMDAIIRLRDKPFPCRFRVCLDYPDAERHDSSRGEGSFLLGLDSLTVLHKYGFGISVARKRHPGEDSAALKKAYQKLLGDAGLPSDTKIIAYLDTTIKEVESTTASTDEIVSTAPQCSYGRMILKREGHMSVYACTRSGTDPSGYLGQSLDKSLKSPVSTKYSRCSFCLSRGSF